METPILLVVTVLAARWIVRRLVLPPTASIRLGMGCVALVPMLLGEFTLVLWLRGLSISEYLASRDPVVADIAKISFERVVRAAVPFMIILTVVLLVITYFPSTVTWLPSLFGYVPTR